MPNTPEAEVEAMKADLRITRRDAGTEQEDFCFTTAYEELAVKLSVMFTVVVTNPQPDRWQVRVGYNDLYFGNLVPPTSVLAE